nr:immunoglobulin heavy chain junction region [Mus musculus]
CARLTAQASNW